MSNSVPSSRPKITKEDALKELSAFDVSKYPVKVLGIRGYYKKTMGDPSKNDRGIYDDSIMIVSPKFFATFNGNTDPSINRTGIATLIAPQVVMYKEGIHGISGKNPRQAFRQSSFGIKVKRDDKGGVFTDSASAPFFINIHDGGNNTTSSEGCQTIIKSQWNEFNEALKKELKLNNQTLFPYVLIEYK